MTQHLRELTHRLFDGSISVEEYRRAVAPLRASEPVPKLSKTPRWSDIEAQARTKAKIEGLLPYELPSDASKTMARYREAERNKALINALGEAAFPDGSFKHRLEAIRKLTGDDPLKFITENPTYEDVEKAHIEAIGDDLIRRSLGQDSKRPNTTSPICSIDAGTFDYVERIIENEVQRG